MLQNSENQDFYSKCLIKLQLRKFKIQFRKRIFRIRFPRISNCGQICILKCITGCLKFITFLSIFAYKVNLFYVYNFLILAHLCFNIFHLTAWHIVFSSVWKNMAEKGFWKNKAAIHKCICNWKLTFFCYHCLRIVIIACD